MTFDELSYQQRRTLTGLHALGGNGRRLDIAKMSGIDGTKVASSLTRLEVFALVENGEDRNWRITELGNALLAKHTAENPKPKSEPKSEPKPEPKPRRDEMATELRILSVTAPSFNVGDAAWLCRALHQQFSDMPNISAMLGKIADYFSGLSEGHDVA